MAAKSLTINFESISPNGFLPENSDIVVSVIEAEEGSVRRVSSRHSGKKRPFYGSPHKPSAVFATKRACTKSSRSRKIDKTKSKAEKVKNLRGVFPEECLPTEATGLSDVISGDLVNEGVDGTLNQGEDEEGAEVNDGGDRTSNQCVELADRDGDVMVDPSAPIDLEGKTAQGRVKETIRLFNKHYLTFIQEEEQRCKKVQVSTTNGEKSKKGQLRAEDVKKSCRRPDLKAITKMTETSTILYPRKRFGHLPGVDVGHRFYSRVEMVVVGTHGHWLKGIDCMGDSYGKMEEYKGYTFPLAVSIVLSGMYQDDEDNFDEVVYTGQGGNNLLGNKNQAKDQKLVLGNLGLKNSMEQSVPVRVTRGHDCASSYCGKVYTYDGLYKVTSFWSEKGTSGFRVYKYRLRLVKGQPALTTNQVHFLRAQAPRSISDVPGLVCTDITGGQENIPVPATNLINDPPIAPTGYSYNKSIEIKDGLTLPASGPGCNCKETCTDPRICACAKLNGSEFPYVHKDGGRLVEAKPVVYECGPKCRCGPGCVN